MKMRLYGSGEVAKMLGITPRAVSTWSRRHNVGHLISRSCRIYTAADIDIIRRRPGRGRPRKHKTRRW